MSSEWSQSNWDGRERRAVPEYIHDLELKINRITAHLESELGGNGSVGNINYRIGEIKSLLQSHQEKFDMVMHNGDKGGLVTRVKELETAHSNHARFAWTGITVAVGLGITSLWNLVTGKQGG